MVGPLVAGFLAGAAHVASGPDHLAAVAPLVARTGRRGWRGGVRWGLGHSAGVALIAVLALLLREALPIERLSGFAERLVGIVLVAIGLWAVHVALRTHVHVHEHSHDGESHVHFHVHGKGHHDVEQHTHTHAAFGIGVLHGLAGSSHFLAVLPALGLPTRTDAIAYLFGYGGGTVAAMAIFARLVSELSVRSGARGALAFRGVLAGCGVVAVVVGCYWIASV